MKVSDGLLILILLGISYLIYRDHSKPQVVSEKLISIEEDLVALNLLLYKRDSFEADILKNINSLKKSYRQVTSVNRIQNSDSLVLSVNELLSK